MKAPEYIANFDSATAMLRANARFLRGRSFAQLGMMPESAMPLMGPVADSVNLLPERARERLYVRSGWGEAIPPKKLADVSAEEVARWMVSEYPRRRYQAAAVGSSNGALAHLWAALGIPWLPQTFLVPVRRTVHPDEPRESMEWGKEHAPALLEANPELQLHHMHDANQDRLMIERMTYFRVKRLRLGESYERFLQETLSPGATIFVVDCRLRWPTVLVGERHVFQHGAPGGASPEEYLHGSERVERYLEQYGSHRRRWDSPEPDGESPEAEWGFEPALGEDVERFAGERGYRVRRIVFEEPEDVSPLVADLYRRWYGQRGLLANRLLVESFILLEPFWALRTGSVPFWLKFPMELPAALLEQYLNNTDPYDEIHMMLFSHGVDSVGLAPIERWRALLEKARKRGGFVGVDEQRFPRDFATFVRYHTEVKKIPARYPRPGPLSLDALNVFLEQAGDDYPVRWE
jgi:hypothetical protein